MATLREAISALAESARPRVALGARRLGNLVAGTVRSGAESLAWVGRNVVAPVARRAHAQVEHVVRSRLARVAGASPASVATGSRAGRELATWDLEVIQRALEVTSSRGCAGTARQHADAALVLAKVDGLLGTRR